MALTSTLFTGLSGLDVNQTRLNVVGNNIANVEHRRVQVQPGAVQAAVLRDRRRRHAADGDFGGENPSQRGLGASSRRSRRISPRLDRTDRQADRHGDRRRRASSSCRATEQRFTRDGSFTLNQSNQLVTTGGEFVQGFGVDDDGNVIAGTLQNMKIPLGSLTQAKATKNVTFKGNLNADGAKATGASDLAEQPVIDRYGHRQSARCQQPADQSSRLRRRNSLRCRRNLHALAGRQTRRA